MAPEEEVAVTDGAEDAELVRRTLGGDRRAFEELIRRYMGAVFAIALREAPAASDAEDIAQDCFVRAYHNLGSLEEPAAFRGWLKRIAVNLARDVARSRIRHGELGEAAPSADGEDGDRLAEIQPASGDPSASQKVRLAETRREIIEAIASLPEEYAQVAAMKYMENLDYGEMERRLRISREALRKRLHRANLMLRKALRRTFPEFAEEE
jgi:RNA polymerase sigma-70 factor (ECF subfamily)